MKLNEPKPIPLPKSWKSSNKSNADGPSSAITTTTMVVAMVKRASRKVCRPMREAIVMVVDATAMEEEAAKSARMVGIKVAAVGAKVPEEIDGATNHQ